ncbi:unnamed protein product [Paramecium octaurelia]|uniref:Cullin family profile domain-containing protein n=1 Tax=Paramecium octaurelia TaxID=43137 RepID=A0A8S1UDU0_PAROT|nr:unnamed protein product [Paramecium octaurelia]
MIIENEDSDLEIISKYFKNEADEFEVYEATRFLSYHHRQDEILELISDHYSQYKEKIDTLMNIEEDSILFDMTIDLWVKFKQKSQCIKDVLKYLDIKTPVQNYITNILLKLIKLEVENRLQMVTLLEIKRYRQVIVTLSNQQAIEDPPLQLLDLLILLPNYQQFERRFYEQSQIYYKEFILDTNPSQSVQIANIIFQAEKKLSSKFQNEFQLRLNELLKQLIFNQVNMTDLDSLYFNTEIMLHYVRFAQEINALPKLLSALRKHIYKEVICILQQQPTSAIENMLNLEKTCQTLFEQLPMEHTNATIITHAIEDAVNENYEKYSFTLASVINLQNQHSIKKYKHLIKYLTDKESFQNYYVKFLIKRILKEYNQNELELLNELQPYCNSEWISESLEFIKNSKESQNLTNQFLQKLRQKKSPIQFHFHLIPKSIWPYQIENLILPSPLNQFADNFIKNQSEDLLFQKKKIIFQSKLSKLNLLVKIDHQFELELPLAQGLELLRFNAQKSINQISNYKQYNGLIIRSENNTFKINYQYKHANQLMILNEEIQIEMEKNQQIISDYLYVVDAAIVKIIKQNKKINSENLIQATFDLIKKEYPRFIDLCEYDIIEKQIVSLLEKEMIKQRFDDFELL